MMCELENMSEDEKGYWADVHYYMGQNSCDKQTAIKAIEEIYIEYSKARKAQYVQELTSKAKEW